MYLICGVLAFSQLAQYSSIVIFVTDIEVKEVVSCSLIYLITCNLCSINIMICICKILEPTLNRFPKNKCSIRIKDVNCDGRNRLYYFKSAN